MANDIKSIVNDVIGDFINEELSINSELECSVNEFCNNVMDRFNSYDKESYTRTGVTLSDGTQSLISSCMFNVNLHLMGKEFKCLVKVCVFWDKKTLIEFYEQFDIGSEFNQSGNSFKFTFPCIRGNGIDRQFMYNAVYHEVEHSLQFIMIGDKTLNDKYLLSLSIMNGKIPNKISPLLDNIISNNFDIALLIATTYYFYYPLELDAKINGLYGELIENGLKIMETNYWVNKKEAEKKVKEALDYGENDDIRMIYKLFGFNNLNQFSKYIERQKDYLTHKEMKVIQRAKNKLSLDESITFISHHSKMPYFSFRSTDFLLKSQ